MKTHLITAKPNSLSTRWKVWMKEKMLQSLWTHISLTIKPQWAACDAAFSSNTPVFDLLVAFGPCCPFMCYYITHHSGIYIHPSMITSFFIPCGLEITPVQTVWVFFLNPWTFCASTTELISDSFQVQNRLTDLSLKGPLWDLVASGLCLHIVTNCCSKTQKRDWFIHYWRQ